MTKDKTAAVRQKRRTARLADQGLYRKSLLVHEKCSAVFEQIKPYLANPKIIGGLETFFETEVVPKPINVSKVRQLSPFRYPGGKTWLVPEIKKWVLSHNFKPSKFIEPFAGGGIASLSVAVEDLAQQVVMSEIDPDVAAVWHTILNDPKYLCNRILNFEINQKNVLGILRANTNSVRERAFQTIVKNRTQRSGILAPGASLIKNGENGKGLSSRWYPETLARRINVINEIKEKLVFLERDAFEVVNKYKKNKKALFFIDPPYTVGGKKAGKRLYKFNVIDHQKLFYEMSRINGYFLMTYDDASEVIQLANKYEFKVTKIPMKNSHHDLKYELLIKKFD